MLKYIKLKLMKRQYLDDTIYPLLLRYIIENKKISLLIRDNVDIRKTRVF
jgi:hypothetical protein